MSKFIQCAVILINRNSGWISTGSYYVLLSSYLFAAFVFIFQCNGLLMETLNLFCLVKYQLVRVASLSNACAELLAWNIREFVLMRTWVGVDHQKLDTSSTLIFVCKNAYTNVLKRDTLSTIFPIFVILESSLKIFPFSN